MKVCSACTIEKPLTDFGKNTCKPDGLCAACKLCRNARRKAQYYVNPRKSIEAAKLWNRQNRERCRANSKARYARNPEPYKAGARAYYADNPERVKAYQKLWRAENPGTCKAVKASRRALKLKATPEWLSEFDKFEMVLLYAQASLMTRERGESYHVDHYVPLKSDVVCGLHVPWNLRVITGVENSKKKNNLPPELQDWVFSKD